MTGTTYTGGVRAAIVGLALLALVGVAAVAALTGPAAAQEEVHNDTLPGVTADEQLDVTVDVLWNASADGQNDTATMDFEHVTDAANDTVANTTTETVNADPGNWTTVTVTLDPDEDVEEFRLQVNASTAGTVDDVDVTSETVGAGTTGTGTETGDGIVAVLAVVVLLGLAYVYRES